MRMAALLAVIAGGCDGTGQERPRPVSPPASRPSVPSYRMIDRGPVGTVSGTVRWRGDVPAPVDITLPDGHPCGRTRQVPSVRVGSTGGVEGAVIVLEGIREGRLPMGGELRFSFSDCRLSPAVAATSVGATVRFQNDEDILHNVRVVGGREGWLDVGLPTRGATTEAIARAGVHRITDDAAHPWIEAYLYVADHPYVAVTSSDGRFTLPRVPVGSYQIRLWHPGILDGGPTSSGRPSRSAPIVLARPLAISEGNDSPTDFELDATSVEAAGALAQ
jgi:hypothetical protein